MCTRKFFITTAVLLSVSTAMAQYGRDIDTLPTLDASETDVIVYFVRPAVMGSDVDFWSFVDDTLIGVTRGTNCVVGKVPAGERVVWSKGSNVSALSVELEAGETYHFKQNVRIVGARPQVNLELMDTTEAEDVISGCQHKELTRAGVEQGREVLAADYEEAVDRANE